MPSRRPTPPPNPAGHSPWALWLSLLSQPQNGLPFYGMQALFFNKAQIFYLKIHTKNTAPQSASSSLSSDILMKRIETISPFRCVEKPAAVFAATSLTYVGFCSSVKKKHLFRPFLVVLSQSERSLDLVKYYLIPSIGWLGNPIMPLVNLDLWPPALPWLP